ncbi:MAG: Maf family nucleotide pyrophosphatase [Magnetococcus sp. DMHC-6]
MNIILNLKKIPIRLASASPRRLELLRQLGLTPDVFPVHVDERPGLGEGALAYVERVARAKTMAAIQKTEQTVLTLGADTAVVLDDLILGKPLDRQHATAMLERVSGNLHQVLTGVAIHASDTGLCFSRVVQTEVWIKKLSSQEIQSYIDSGEPMDKAGAYAIQGLGAFLVAKLQGSYSNVVGLPLFETLELFQNILDKGSINLDK